MQKSPISTRLLLDNQDKTLVICPYARTSHAATNNCRRIIYRFNSANSVVRCAMFLAKPRKRVFT